LHSKLSCLLKSSSLLSFLVFFLLHFSFILSSSCSKITQRVRGRVQGEAEIEWETEGERCWELEREAERSGERGSVSGRPDEAGGKSDRSEVRFSVGGVGLSSAEPKPTIGGTQELRPWSRDPQPIKPERPVKPVTSYPCDPMAWRLGFRWSSEEFPAISNGFFVELPG
jgi:hypothetical protein